MRENEQETEYRDFRNRRNAREYHSRDRVRGDPGRPRGLREGSHRARKERYPSLYRFPGDLHRDDAVSAARHVGDQAV